MREAEGGGDGQGTIWSRLPKWLESEMAKGGNRVSDRHVTLTVVDRMCGPR